MALDLYHVHDGQSAELIVRVGQACVEIGSSHLGLEPPDFDGTRLIMISYLHR